MTHKQLFLFAGIISAFLLIKSIFITLTIADALIALGAICIYIVKISVEFLTYKFDKTLPPKEAEILPELKAMQDSIARKKLQREDLAVSFELEKLTNASKGKKDDAKTFGF